mgnify:CR=1 FL=1
MDLTPTPEQEALRSAARDFLGDILTLEKVNQIADGEPGWEPEVWSTIAELGWLGLSVPEDAGGAGMGLLEEAVVFEESGGALLPAPLFSTVALALPAVVASGDAALITDVVEGRLRLAFAWGERGVASRLAEAPRSACRAAPDGTAPSGWVLTGTKHWVADLTWTQSAVVVAATPDGPGLFLVDLASPGVTITRRSTLDATRRLSDLTLANVPARPLVLGAEVPGLLEQIRRRAIVLGAAESVGIADRMLVMSRDHASTREQFGRIIGTYQAVSHKIADLYLGAELARSLVIWAAWSVDQASPDAAAAVTAAAAKAASVAVSACETTIQVLGGIGMTWDAGVHRYYKRAMALEALDGPPSIHRRALAAELLAA